MSKSTPLPLSVSIVCCNSAAMIGRLLDSVEGLASEIVAVDSGSTDNTIDLLRARGATVVNQPWQGFVKQKQHALNLCKQPWVLNLDSDESLEPELRESIRAAIERDDPDIAGYELNRKIWYAGRFLKHAWQPEWRLRLVRRECARSEGCEPHDHMEIIPGPGPQRIDRLAGDMRHDAIPTGITNFLAKQASHAHTAARTQCANGRRGKVSRLVFSPVAEFTKQIIIRSAWRDGWRGWVAASACATAAAMKHAALIEESMHSRAENKP